MPLPDRLAMLDRQLFEVEGFSGNRDDYFDPRNSFLNDVIERRTGIPHHAFGGLPGSRLAAGTAAGAGVVPGPLPRGLHRRPARLHRPVQPRRPRRERRSGDATGRDRRWPGTGPALPSAGDRTRVTPGGGDADPSQPQADLRQAAGPRPGCSWCRTAWLRWTRTDAAAFRERGHVLARLECYQAAWHDYRHYLRLAPFAGDAADIEARAERFASHRDASELRRDGGHVRDPARGMETGACGPREARADIAGRRALIVRSAAASRPGTAPPRPAPSRRAGAHRRDRPAATPRTARRRPARRS